MAQRIRWQILIAAVSSLLVLGLMASLALTATSVPRPLPGGAYVEAVFPPPRQINPLVSDPARDPSSADLQVLLFDGLMRIGADGLPAPALAQNLPEISDSGDVYTFTLRTGVTWHDGQPLTADDVVFTLRAVQGSAFTGDPAVRELWRNALIDKVNDRQVRAQLSAPFAALPSLATFPILPAHLLRDMPPEQWATAGFNQTPIGTGPYRLSDLTADGARLTANTTYYAGKPFIESIVLRFYPGPAEAFAALGRNEVTGLGVLATGDRGPGTLPRSLQEQRAPLDGYTVLTFNLREALLSDQGFRRALATGLNKDELIARAIDGQGQRIDTPILPGWWAPAVHPGWYQADQARAADLLTSLGFQPGADGVRVRDGRQLILALITDDAPDRRAAAQEIARQWGALGIRVEIEQLDPATLRERLDQRRFTLALHSWGRLGSDPDVFELWHSEWADSGANYAGLKDSQVDDLLASGRQDPDIESRLATYGAFQRRWSELAPSIVLYEPYYRYITSAELGGLDFEALPDTPTAYGTERLLYGREDRFRNIYRWFLRSSREIRGDLRQTP
jgi:peptide/nickel transport system substrate-binding protein